MREYLSRQSIPKHTGRNGFRVCCRYPVDPARGDFAAQEEPSDFAAWWDGDKVKAGAVLYAEAVAENDG